MRENVLENDLYGRKYTGFKNYEVLKLERDLAQTSKQGLNMNDEELTTHLIRFYEYFKEYDRRRNLNFLETFPEMKEFWNEAKELYEENMGRRTQEGETLEQYKQRMIDPISESYCAAKWYNATIWLGHGQTASCHHHTVIGFPRRT